MARSLRDGALVCAAFALSGCVGQLMVFGDPGQAPAPSPRPGPETDAGVWMPPPPPPPPDHDAGPEAPAPMDGGQVVPLPGPDAALPPRIDGGGGTTTPPGACAYPSGATGRVRMGDVMTAYRWGVAFDQSGARTALDLERFHCDDEYAGYDAVLFVIGTAWCPNCPDYMRTVASMDLPRTLVVWLETQNSSYASASSEEARATVDRIVGAARGLRIGERDNSRRDAIGDQISSIPTGVFVRRSDMRILAFENELGRRAPWESMARDPSQDWVSILRGGGSGSACGPSDEESSEPNDSSAAAAPIGPGMFRGGICGSDSDYYAVSLSGRWRMDLDFRHSTGDLDVIVTDTSGRTIATADSGDDDETLTATGPAIIRIYGYRGARAPYTLTLTEL